jgi:predicted transglutaminase-like cysteine proteinase
MIKLLLAVLLLTSACAASPLINEATYVNDTVNKYHTWVSDYEQFGVVEHWQSHYKQVLAKEEFYDDCDGAALTKAEMLLHRKVFAFEDIKIALVCTEACQRSTEPMDFDHMVVLVNIEGVDYLLDDWDKWTFVEPAGRSPHRIHSTMKMSEVGRFKKVGE